MGTIKLELVYALEVGQLLEFIDDWLDTAHGTGRHLAPSLAQFVGNRAHNIEQLRTDVPRLRFVGATSAAPFRTPD